VNPTLADLVGGVQAVTLGDEEARRRGTQKTVLERKAPPTFDVLVEQESWQRVIVHQDVAMAVDSLLRGQPPMAEQRERDEQERVTARTVVAAPTEMPGAQRASGAEWDVEVGYGARRRRGSRNRQMTYDPRRDLAIVPDEEEALALEEIEPTGTTGALSQSTPRGAKPKPVRIYPFGISRERLEQSARQLRVPVEIIRDQGDADAVIALKTFYRRQGEQLRNVESARTPVYVLRTNTVAQMQDVLQRIFAQRRSAHEATTLHDGAPASAGVAMNPTMAAMEEAEDAIHYLLSSSAGRVDLMPQNAYVRRLQHQIAGRYNLESRSAGREPNRRVQIWAR
ncbi:MAG TPA: R3H domain-containing nucleic acid-binding protein, partial [Ktedonobacterales bacterium]|nr:R3H domain-containing nucleic acid-binding protein [Ktedonobacterales bacterium]